MLVLVSVVATWLITDFVYYQKHLKFIKNLNIDVVYGVSESDIQNWTEKGGQIKSIRNSFDSKAKPSYENRTSTATNINEQLDRRKPAIIISSQPVSQADDLGGTTFSCLNAGNNMDNCKTNQAATSCAQMACQLNGSLISPGERFTMSQMYQNALCSQFEERCGFDGPGGGGGGGNGGGDDIGDGCNGNCEVDCPWWAFICRSVHSSSTSQIFW